MMSVLSRLMAVSMHGNVGPLCWPLMKNSAHALPSSGNQGSASAACATVGPIAATAVAPMMKFRREIVIIAYLDCAIATVHVNQSIRRGDHSGMRACDACHPPAWPHSHTACVAH